MKYAHILLALTEERWAIREEKLVSIIEFMQLQAQGTKFSAEELEARITKTTEQAIARQQGAVAILPLRGVIANRMSLMSEFSGGTSVEGFSRVFQSAVKSEEIKAIVLDVDSPGGAVSGADELSSLIYAARGTKPIIAQVDAMCASAAYWIASAADEIVCTPTGSVGSIGVLGIHQDISGALEQAGIKPTIISAGRFKADGRPEFPLDDASRARMQARVDAAYEMFVKAVARNRNAPQARVRDGFGQGDMVDAGPSLAEGMIDGLATTDETLKRFGASLYAPTAGAPDEGDLLDVKRAFPRRREKAALSLG